MGNGQFAYIVGGGFGTKSASYVANGVDFDGANDYLTRGGDLTGNVNSKVGYFAAWINPATTGSLHELFHGLIDGNARIRVQLSAGDFRVIGKNSSNTTILDMKSDSISTGVWTFVAASWDLTDTNKRHIIVNESDDLTTVAAYTNDTILYTGATNAYSIGGNNNGNDLFDGDMVDMSFNQEYIDFSNAVNLRKFILNGKPVDRGSDGTQPTGTAPIIYQSKRLGESASDFATNKGTGGGFTENGTLTDSTTSPSD